MSLLPNNTKIREYPCPKCDTGELYDANAGGMFASDIQCDNPNCDFHDSSDFIGCTGADIDD